MLQVIQFHGYSDGRIRWLDGQRELAEWSVVELTWLQYQKNHEVYRAEIRDQTIV